MKIELKNDLMYGWAKLGRHVHFSTVKGSNDTALYEMKFCSVGGSNRILEWSMYLKGT